MEVSRREGFRVLYPPEFRRETVELVRASRHYPVGDLVERCPRSRGNSTNSVPPRPGAGRPNLL